jgi:hypothetical protein
MKVVCIKKVYNLTFDKTYVVIDDPYLIFRSGILHGYSGIYLIIDDMEQPTWYNDDILMHLEKWRESKLTELGI